VWRETPSVLVTAAGGLGGKKGAAVSVMLVANSNQRPTTKHLQKQEKT
jgi:hypothetical protein